MRVQRSALENAHSRTTHRLGIDHHASALVLPLSALLLSDSGGYDDDLGVPTSDGGKEDGDI